MARPSVLTDKQWADIEKRVPPLGTESIRSVAREYKVSEGVIRKRVNTQTKPLNALANQIAKTELAFEQLPINAQFKVRSIADRLKGISEHLGGAAEMGAMTAHRLSILANAEAQKIDETDPMNSISQLKSVAALTDMANKASSMGLNLLAASKGQVQPDPAAGTAKQLTDDELAAIIAGGGA